MKRICILTVAALLAAAPIMLWAAADGAALYEEKCAMCHGAKGEGVPDSMPAVKGIAMTAEDLTKYLLKGDPSKAMHANPVDGLNEEQAKAIADFVKAMK